MGIYATDTLHQQIPYLRVIFLSQETQRMSAMKAEDIVIKCLPTRNLRGAGLAPLPPSLFFVCGGGGHSGMGYGSGDSNHGFGSCCGGGGGSSGFGGGGIGG